MRLQPKIMVPEKLIRAISRRLHATSLKGGDPGNPEHPSIRRTKRAPREWARTVLETFPNRWTCEGDRCDWWYSEPYYVSWKDLTPRERPDLEKAQALAREIETNRLFHPVEITNDGVILDGHHRWLAVRVLGRKSIPVQFCWLGLLSL